MIMADHVLVVTQSNSQPLIIDPLKGVNRIESSLPGQKLKLVASPGIWLFQERLVIFSTKCTRMLSIQNNQSWVFSKLLLCFLKTLKAGNDPSI